LLPPAALHPGIAKLSEPYK